MPQQLVIPELGESITEAQIVKWRKSEGDRVEQDEIVADLETDKATVELPATVAGVIENILKEEGSTVQVGEAIAEITDGAHKGRTNDTHEANAADEPDEVAQSPRKNKQESKNEDAPPVETQPRLMPAAQTAMDRYGLDAERIEGTGPAGRILPRDVERVAREKGKQPHDGLRASNDAAEHVVAMTDLQQYEAARVLRAWTTIPQAWLIEEIDLRAALELFRNGSTNLVGHNDDDLNITSYIASHVLRLIGDFPEINAEVRGVELVYKRTCHLAVALPTDHGHVEPVIRNADRMPMSIVSRSLHKAREKASRLALEPADLDGATLTLEATHFGRPAYSIPAVRFEQSAALALNARRRHAPDGGGTIALSFAYDQRIVTASRAEEFLRTVKTRAENPLRSILLS